MQAQMRYARKAKRPIRVVNALWPIILVLLAMATAAALLDRAGVIDVVSTLKAGAEQNPTLSPFVLTYERGLHESARLKSDKAALERERAKLKAALAQNVQLNADLAAQKQSLQKAQDALDAERAALAEQRAALIGDQRAGGLDDLISYYSEMDADAAAKILVKLDDQIVRRVLAGLDARQAARILAAIDPSRAAAITEAMATLPSGASQEASHG